MALAAGDRVIPRSLVGSSLTETGILAQPPIVGYVTDVGSSLLDVLWSNGIFNEDLDISSAPVTPVLEIDDADPSTLTTFAGRVVSLADGSPEMTGVVLMVLKIELVPDSGTFTNCVIVKSIGPSQAYWVAAASAVNVVGNQ